MTTDPPFSMALRLVAYAARDREVQLRDIENLPRIASRECCSTSFPPNEIPSGNDADEAVRKSFADHLMVNTHREPHETLTVGEPEVLVTAQVVIQPELAVVAPGEKFPTTGDDRLSEVLLVHRTPMRLPDWADEAAAAEILLQQIVAALPREDWRENA